MDEPTDRGEWGMTPQTINAYYNPTFNEVVFPAAILQPPFFDPNADPAVNYGGIGGVIGHEMGHGFDDQGAKSDARGVLRNWWLPEDTKAFKASTSTAWPPSTATTRCCPDSTSTGGSPSGKTSGISGGLSIAYVAYHRSLAGHKAAGARRLERRSALFPGLGAGVAHAEAR